MFPFGLTITHFPIWLWPDSFHELTLNFFHYHNKILYSSISLKLERLNYQIKYRPYRRYVMEDCFKTDIEEIKGINLYVSRLSQALMSKNMWRLVFLKCKHSRNSESRLFWAFGRKWEEFKNKGNIICLWRPECLWASRLKRRVLGDLTIKQVAMVLY